MKIRVYACLLANERGELEAMAIGATSIAEAIEHGRAEAARLHPGKTVVGALTQEDLTRIGMVLAAGRVALDEGHGSISA